MATARAGRVVDFLTLTLRSPGGTLRWPTLPARWHVLLLRRHKPAVSLRGIGDLDTSRFRHHSLRLPGGGCRSTSGTKWPASCNSRAITNRMLPCSAASRASSLANSGLPRKFICSVAVTGMLTEGRTGPGATAGSRFVGGRSSVSVEILRTSSAPLTGVRFNAILLATLPRLAFLSPLALLAPLSKCR